MESESVWEYGERSSTWVRAMLVVPLGIVPALRKGTSIQLYSYCKEGRRYIVLRELILAGLGFF